MLQETLKDVSFASGWTLKDAIQEVSLLAGILAVLGTLIKSWFESKLSREQSARDLRWKQAEAAKSLNDEMMNDPEANDATLMLDFPGRKVEIPPDNFRIEITYNDIRRSLNPRVEPTDDTGLHIRDCFDSLFYYLATLEHYIDSTLILPEDVQFPLDYYLRLLAELRPEVKSYLQAYRLDRAEAFLRRYPFWSKG